MGATVYSAMASDVEALTCDWGHSWMRPCQTVVTWRPPPSLEITNTYVVWPLYKTKEHNSDGNCIRLDRPFQHPGIIFPVEAEQCDIQWLSYTVHSPVLKMGIQPPSVNSYGLTLHDTDVNQDKQKDPTKLRLNHIQLYQCKHWPAIWLFQLYLVHRACACWKIFITSF